MNLKVVLDACLFEIRFYRKL